jgi:uroporphyrinogen decarboxylase
MPRPLTGRQRIRTVLAGGIPDRVPYFDFVMSRRFIRHVTGEEPLLYRSDTVVPCCAKAGIDAAWIPVRGFMGCEYEAGAGGQYTDEFGVVLRKTEASWPVNAPVASPVRTPADVKAYRFPEPGRDRAEDVAAAVRRARGEVAVFAGIPGPLRTAWFLMGFENICLNLVDAPGCVRELFGGAVEFTRHLLEALEGLDIDGIVVSEDMGFASGTYFSPDVFRSHVFPFQRELVRHARKLGVPVILHSDGNLNAILDDLVAMGFDAYHPFERAAAMDIFAARERYPDAVLIGNLDSKSTLVEGDPQRIRRDAVDCIRRLGARGRYILASDHSINDGIRPETILELRGIVEAEGAYPLLSPSRSRHRRSASAR